MVGIRDTQDWLRIEDWFVNPSQKVEVFNAGR